MDLEDDLSWIDIYLSDGDPHRVYGSDAEKALSHMMKLRDLPYLWLSYRKAGIPLREQVVFLGLDVIRSIAYRKGFQDGADFPWPEEP